MSDLCTILQNGEAWLLDRVLATTQAPSRYLTALEEVWHQSFLGLTSALVESLKGDTGPDQEDSAAAFGRLEARRHRERGVSLDLLLSLLKLYRPAYLDLVRKQVADRAEAETAILRVDRFFDRVEVAFCRAWVAEAEAGGLKAMAERSLELVTERDRYVTIFESLPTPLLLLGPDLSVQNLNHAAAKLFFGHGIPGAWYYQKDKRPVAEALTALFPAFFEELEAFRGGGLDRQEREWTAQKEGRALTFRVLISRMLDLPSTFAGILVTLDDLTERIHAAHERERLIGELTRSLAEIKQLSGLLPICAWCKKIRDDQGYWAQLESYLSSHTGVMFSHSVCPDCATRLRYELRGADAG